MSVARSSVHSYFQSIDECCLIKEAEWTGVLLGSGAFVEVKEVRVNGVLCAGKQLVLHEWQKITREEEIKRYVYECQLLTKLNHPNVVTCVGLWYPNTDSIPVLVMEKLEYTAFGLLWENNFALPFHLKVSIMEDVANGLHYLHTRSPPIIHRDLKGETIHLTSTFVGKICSFGSACQVTEQAEHEHLLLRLKGALLPASVAPEATTSHSKCDTSMDVFSFGHTALCLFIEKLIILYDLLPITFVDDDCQLQARTPVECREKYFKELKQQLPGGEDHRLIPLLNKCLSNDPLARPTAQELVDSFRIISNGLEGYHIQACRQAVKKKGSLKQIIMQAVMLGLSRCGKSSLKNRLVGKKLKDHSSTGVATKAAQVRIGKSAVQVSGTVWNELTNIHDAIFMAVTEISNSLTAQAPRESCELEKPTAALHAVSTSPPSDTSLVVSESTEATYISTQQKPQQENDTHVFGINPIDLIESAVQQRTVDYGRLLRHLREPWTLYITDAGGQPEFQELLPVLISGPTLFFLVFPLHKDLHQKCTIEYLDSNGRSTVPFEASYTVVETLLQSLASIVSTQRFKNLQSGDTFVPKVLFVGTHKDKVTPEKIVEIDEVLQEYIKQTDAYEMDSVEFATENRMIVAVDNLSENDEGIEEVRKIVNRIGQRGDYNIPTPYPWLIFGMNINLLEKSVLTYEECFQLAKKCGIESTQELNDALWFLHNYTGTVRHFPSVPDLVINNPQYIFDRVTEMIVSTFTFERTGHHIQQQFMKKGIFPLETFQRLTQKHDSIPPHKLISLLEHLHIIAPIVTDGVVKKYFLPCALTHAALPPTQETQPAIPSLYIIFTCGYCPKGLFGSLVTYLMSQNTTSKFKDWELEEDHIYRNQVSFSVGPLEDSFRFIFNPSYIRIDLMSLPDEDRTISPGLVCCDVYKSIQDSIAQLMSTLHYSSLRTISSVAFECPETLLCGHHEFHLAKVKFHNKKPITMICSQSKKKFVFKKDSNYMYWFNEEAQFPSTEESAHSFEQSTMPHTCHESLGRPSRQADSSPHLCESEVLGCLYQLAYDWFNIGVFLNIDSGELKGIERDNRRSTDCLREMIGLWLRRDNPRPTWGELCEAVKILDPSKATEIEETYMNRAS